MKTQKLIYTAALAIIFAACSNDDNELPQQSKQQAQSIHFVATINPTNSNGAKTRTILNDNGTNISVAWKQGDQIALVHNSTKDIVSVKTVNTDGSATIEGDITNDADDADVVLVYPADAVLAAETGTSYTPDYTYISRIQTQNGTLEYIQNYLDGRQGAGKLSFDGNTASLKANVNMYNSIAIFKLTLKNIDGTNDVSAKSVKITNQSNTVLTTVTPASGYDNVMYVALPTTATRLKFLVTGSDDKKYFNMASGLSLGANFYQSTVKLATVGDVILSTGKCAKAGTANPVAMIAYLGNGSECTNGLAIQLNSDPEYNTWDNAKTLAASLAAVPGGTWRLPSKTDWQNMFIACAIISQGDTDSPNNGMQILGFREKIAATGISWLSLLYWTSTESGSNAWRVGVYLDGNNADAYFHEFGPDNTYRILGCLAF